MASQRQPVLEHQRVELERSTRALDELRPGASRDMDLAVFYEADAHRALARAPGRERSAVLRSWLQREEAYRAAPQRAADRVVKHWRALEKEHGAMRGEQHRAQRELLEERLKFMVRQIKADPALEKVLQERARERTLELSRGRELSLGRVMRERTLERALELALPSRSRSLGMDLER
jgi:hypothetical protein